jgi:hypothetical protein
MTKRSELLIDPNEVEKAFLDCLYREEEIEGPGKIPEGAVVVEGIFNKFAFHPERLEEKRTKITAWLKALPHQFRIHEGGGWSFLNACLQDNGLQWTDLQVRMEQLFCLGIGLGLVDYLLPRELWSSMPGNVPYYVIDL